MKTGRLRLTSILVLLFVTMILSVSLLSGADFPHLINYSGTLADENGNPVADGEYNVEFNIYDAQTGGNALWTEVWNETTNKVSVFHGSFNVMLGKHKTISDSFFTDHPTTYLGIKVGADSEMLPRQRIASVAYAFTAGSGGFPKGGIIMWSGTIEQIPAGWALCDGVERTLSDGSKVRPPDLRKRFIMGAGNSYEVDVTGGVSTINIQHSHVVDNHSHTMNHTHTYSGTSGQSDYNRDRSKGDYSTAGDTHKHTFSGTTSDANTGATGSSSPGTSAQLGQAQSILPPYYSLAFIMKL
jgi:hypothetical protein